MAVHRVRTDLQAMRNLLFGKAGKNQIEDAAFGCGKRHLAGISLQPFEHVADALRLRLGAEYRVVRGGVGDLQLDAPKLQLLSGLNVRQLDALSFDIGSVAAVEIAHAD